MIGAEGLSTSQFGKVKLEVIWVEIMWGRRPLSSAKPYEKLLTNTLSFSSGTTVAQNKIVPPHQSPGKSN